MQRRACTPQYLGELMRLFVTVPPGALITTPAPLLPPMLLRVIV